MKKILLYPHGGSRNHGCEAIVRSTLQMLKPEEACLMTSSPEEDRAYGLDQLVNLVTEQEDINRFSSDYLAAAFKRRVLGVEDAFDRLAFKNIAQEAEDAEVALSIGGDNYCYNTPVHLFLKNELIRETGTPTVLWGCSVERKDMVGSLLDDLKEFSMVVARESLTFEALQDRKVTRAVFCPDPAFILPAAPVSLPEGWQPNNMVGINVSPLIIASEYEEGCVLGNYIQLIEYILRSTDMGVALIPHVTWSFNDDRKPLNFLYQYFNQERHPRHKGRVILVQDASCCELKGYISHCRFFVAARTHASIAAYSTGIPTLVVGYSSKATGIARDLFGTDDGYVVPARNLMNPNDLKDAFAWLMKRETGIKDLYAAWLPEYISRVESFPRKFKQLLRESCGH